MARSSGREYDEWMLRKGAALRERERLARESNAQRMRGHVEKAEPAPPEPEPETAKRKPRKAAQRERFYRSPEWLAVREMVFERDGRHCAKCAATERLNIDHILPRSKFPELQLALTNLRVLCWPCNKRKGVSIELRDRG